MSDRYPGGIITKTPVTPAGPYAEGSAPGVWTLEQQAYWQAQGLWPSASNPTPNDPYFQYVTSLLHGDGTNGGQNNTFLDSSTNAFTITRNGNTTQGSFSPYGSNWGMYDSGGSALQTSYSGSIGASDDFTIEVFAYLTSTTDNSILCVADNATGLIYFRNGSKFSTTLNGTTVEWQSSAVQLNVWTHFVVQRSSGTVSAYVNGIRVGTPTAISGGWSWNTISGSGTPFLLGQSNVRQIGYYSNARYSNIARYSGTSFTVPTAAFTSDANTVFLLASSNRFMDGSSNNRNVSVYSGTPQVTRFSPFSPTYATQYSASTIGGSGYFDGSGDYLTSSSISLTGDFTIECWANQTSLAQNGGSINIGDATNSQSLALYINTNGALSVFYNGSNVIETGLANPSAWHHIAVTKSGSTGYAYLDGVRLGTFSASATLSGTIEVGSVLYSGTRYVIKGYTCDARIIDGTALYTGTTLTVPTAPLTAITNTKFLCNFTNAAIYDNAEIPNWETVDNEQISTGVKKYGTGSIRCFNNGSLNTVATDSFAFGTGNFTVEGWVYVSSIGSYQGVFSTGVYPSASQATLRITDTGKLQWFWGDASLIITGSTSLQAATWYHFAVCRVGSTTKIFVNGTQDASATDTKTYAASGTVWIGYESAAPGYLVGYLDDFRITKGYARYWENFTPPAAALPNFSNPSYVPPQDAQFNYTTLLLPGNGTNGAQNNTFLDSSTNAFTITRNGNTTQGTFSPFSQTGWGNYFGGATNYVGLGTTAFNNISSSSATFTMEAWVIANSYNSPASNTYAPCIFGKGQTYMNFGITGSGYIQLYHYDGSVRTAVSSGKVPLGQWTHVAVVCNGSGTLTFYINGTACGTATWYGHSGSGTSANLGSTADTNASGNANWNGYISNARYTTTQVYTSNFTPSTTPLTAVTGTSLLVAQSNRFIDNSSNAYTLTPTGTPSVQAFSPFAPTAAYSASTVGGSGYFDGTGDYLSVADNAAFALGTNNFTVDGWAWIDSNSSQGVIIAQDTGTISTSSFRVEWDGTINGRVYIGGTQYTLTGTSDLRNCWVHFALVRNGSTVYLYVNGVQEATASVSTDSINDSSGALTIGATSTGGTRPTGYISNVRLVNGTAVYTTAFTPPTAPTTAITNTALLVNFTNAAITDATAKNDLETVGNAQISTTQSKFGGSSMYFDGTGDYLQLPASQYWNFSSGDWTIEGWLYPNTVSGGQILLENTTDGTGGLSIQMNGSAFLVYINSTAINAGTFTASTWQHFALVRYGSTMTAYINGSSVGTSSTTPGTGAAGLWIGSRSGGSISLNGYINDLRITKGYARYVQPFTPPAQADQLY